MSTEAAASAAPESSAPVNEAPASAPAAETPAPEASPSPETPPVKKDPDSAKFAALARKEKANREADQRIKQAEQQLQQRQAEIEARAKEFEDRYKRASSGNLSPIERIRAIGVSPEEVNQALLGGWKEPEVDPVDAKLSPLQKQMEEILKQNEELKRQVEAESTSARQRKQQEDYLKFVDAVNKTVQSDTDKYEYISLYGKEAVDLVQEVMVNHYTTNDNALLSYEEACDLVEEHYESQAEKYSKSRKLQSKFQQPPQQKPQDTPPAKAKDTPATLTADMSAASQATVDISKMSERERLEYITKLITIKK